MTEKVKAIIGSYFLFPEFKSRGHPYKRPLMSLHFGFDAKIEIFVRSLSLKCLLVAIGVLGKIFKKPIQLLNSIFEVD